MSRKISADENERRWLILRNRVYEENIKAAFHLFRACGIEPILIKGWAAAHEYPEKHRRIFNDIDLCVAPVDYPKSLEIVEAEEGKRLNIDLHDGLRHLDTYDWDDLFENSRIVKLDNVGVRILRAEDHLRVLTVHWLTDGGAYREKLSDIYYLLENRAGNFDWDRCFGKLSETRRGWIKKTVAVVHSEFELDVSTIPFADELNDIPRWFLTALEKEWASETNLKPLHTLLGKRREFWKQLTKRFPPNAIQATVEMEGKFDDAPRFYYQIGSIWVRITPSFKRMYNSLKIYFGKKRAGE